MTPIPGTVVRHYKGGRYTVIALAESHEHNGDMFVIYVSHTNGKTFARPLISVKEDAWTDLVDWPDGKKRQRFINDSEDPNDLSHLFPEKT
jgi:hypothetical protein